MRLATFNILSGRSREVRAPDAGRLAVAIRALDADVLGLQEVDRDQPRSAFADLTAVAAEAMGAVHSKFIATIAGTPGRRWVPAAEQDDGATASYGIALLSRYPVISWEVLRMRGVGPHLTLPLPGRRSAVVVGEEPRSTVIAHLETPLGPLTVANTHLSFLPGWNRVQLSRIVRHLSRSDIPAVIMGDLNLHGAAPARVTGWRALASHRTFPAGHPLLQLDHILLQGWLGTVRRTEAIRLPVSDHRAIVVDVDAATTDS